MNEEIYFNMENTVSKVQKRRFFCQNFRYNFAYHHSVDNEREKQERRQIGREGGGREERARESRKGLEAPEQTKNQEKN